MLRPSGRSIPERGGFFATLRMTRHAGIVVLAADPLQTPYGDRGRYPLPALMLLDLKLPGMSGFEVLLWLRQQPGLKRLPVVVLTSSKENTDINRAYELGANSYLVKPASFDALVNIIERLNHYWLVLNERPEVTPPSVRPGMHLQT